MQHIQFSVLFEHAVIIQSNDFILWFPFFCPFNSSPPLCSSFYQYFFIIQTQVIQKFLKIDWSSDVLFTNQFLGKLCRIMEDLVQQKQGCICEYWRKELEHHPISGLKVILGELSFQFSMKCGSLLPMFLVFSLWEQIESFFLESIVKH